MSDNKNVKNNSKSDTILVILILIILTITIILLGFNITKYYSNMIESSTSSNINEGSNISQKPSTDETFSLHFLKAENEKQNVIYSPLSIKYALNLLNEGANGKTKEQIENVKVNLNLTKYDNIDNVLSFANGVYIKESYSKYVKDDYKKTIAEKYNAEINYDTFENASNINKWIEDKTLGIIKNMLTDELVKNTNTEMLLINSLGIDMEWEDTFDAALTRGEDFKLTDGTILNATTMKKTANSDNISYYKDENTTALSIDLKKYNNTKLQFIAIMPNEDLSNYINNLSLQDINNITNNLTLSSKAQNGIDISIPRFSFDYSLNLKDDLIKLGITDAFDTELADFSNMSSNPKGLYVSDALHKANIDFSEKGVKAAATTVIVMTDKAGIISTPQEEITIDKPFIYLIKDKNTDEIWFVGTVYKPNSWDTDKTSYQYK